MMAQSPAHRLVTALLDPDFMAPKFRKAFGIQHLFDEEAFKKELNALDGYEDYLDMLEGLHRDEKRTLIEKVLTSASGKFNLPPGRLAMLDKADITRFHSIMQLKQYDTSRNACWKVVQSWKVAIRNGDSMKLKRASQMTGKRAKSLQMSDLANPAFHSTPTALTGRTDRDSGKAGLAHSAPGSATHSTSVTPLKRFKRGESRVPVPPLSAATFGLVQETLGNDPYAMLVAVQFLNKTPGRSAIPIFRQLMLDFPTASALANIDEAVLTERIRTLGLQSQRAKKLIAFAKMWAHSPPQVGVMYRAKEYPLPGDGRGLPDITFGADTDAIAGALEIAHLPGCGPYAYDCWRMFCRDEFRGKADGFNGEDAEDDFEPEWKRVLPRDKELMAWAKWMWLKEGWNWDPLTGERTAVIKPEPVEVVSPFDEFEKTVIIILPDSESCDDSDGSDADEEYETADDECGETEDDKDE